MYEERWNEVVEELEQIKKKEGRIDPYEEYLKERLLENSKFIAKKIIRCVDEKKYIFGERYISVGFPEYSTDELIQRELVYDGKFEIFAEPIDKEQIIALLDGAGYEIGAKTHTNGRVYYEIRQYENKKVISESQRAYNEFSVVYEKRYNDAVEKFKEVEEKYELNKAKQSYQRKIATLEQSVKIATEIIDRLTVSDGSIFVLLPAISSTYEAQYKCSIDGKELKTYEYPVDSAEIFRFLKKTKIDVQEADMFIYLSEYFKGNQEDYDTIHHNMERYFIRLNCVTGKF